MNKKFGIVAFVLSLIAGVLIFVLSQDKTVETNNNTTPAPSVQNSTPQAVNDAAKPEQAATALAYITVDEYNQNPQAYADAKKVLFFHAPWCPICAGIDKEIVAAPSKIPSGTTIIKSDYDKNTALKQKYGVTYQYTFVQIDNDGIQLKKWSATSIDKVLAQVE